MYIVAMLCFMLINAEPAFSQTKELAVIGSSTAAGLAASPVDSSWVNRFNRYYKYQLGILDSTFNLAVSGTTCYQGMPSSYIAPGGRPAPDAAHNVTMAETLLQHLPTSSDGLVIVNYPTNGYDGYSIPEIMGSLQTIYDSAVKTGNNCFITTTQPRSDAPFSSPLTKKKLADIKDSIIGRFGTAHTLNFWDGMFNPSDSSILTAYSAGDNVHFNNAGHRELFNRVVDKNIFGLNFAPTAGDYRSNVVTTGVWDNAATWQIYDGTSWVAAVSPPTSSDGVITIAVGDSIRMNVATTVDQVVVESGAILAIFNGGGATTFTLNDGPGDDIVNNGKLYVSINSTLTGGGTVQNNFGGVFILRNQGILAVNANNDGTMNISGTGNIQNATLTNNGVITLIDFTLNLNTATLVNNDSVSIAYASDAFIATTAGTGSFVNAAGAVLYKASATGISWINAVVAFSNSGTVKGTGQYNFLNVASNTGTIAPGNSPGILTVNPGFLTGKTPTINLEISSTGNVAGTNYDQLVISTVNSLTANVTGTTLSVTDNAGDPLGTTYTLLSFPSGTITGPFAATQLSPSLGNLVNTGTAITVQKTAVLPLTWGNFTAVAGIGQVKLQWSTLQESNTARFVIERSGDGRQFASIGTVAAKGNSSLVSDYAFTDALPFNGNNYYRLEEIDLDGRGGYSTIQVVDVGAIKTGAVQVTPNPVRDILKVSVKTEGISIRILDRSGKLVRAVALSPGDHSVNVGGLPAGVYQVGVYEKGRRIETLQVVKL
jgi:hypothetical protein